MFYLNRPGSLASSTGSYICGHEQYRPPTAPGVSIPYLALLLHRDYFDRPFSSLACSFMPQGLFRPARCISILLFCSTGIISAGQMHPYLALLLHRDYFHRPVSSLSCSFVPQGLFLPSEFILILLFCSAGIISAGRFHPNTEKPSLPGHSIKF